MRARRVLSVTVGIVMLIGVALVSPPGATAASLTSSEKSKYIATLVSPAQAAQRATGVPASVLIAQAIVESNWGTSAPATKAKNPFGTRCSATMTAAEFAKLALAQVGKKYVFGAEVAISNANPTKFDCSELVEWLFGRSGNPITDLAASQYNVTKAVSGSPKAGDLVFLRNNPARSNGIGHVAVLTKKLSNGDWEIVEAKGKAYGVVKTTLSYWKTRKYYAGLRRYDKLVFAGQDGVVKVSTASQYQAGCVAITSGGKTLKYSKFASITNAFADYANTIAKDSAYASARTKLNNPTALVDALAKVQHPDNAKAYAASVKDIISKHKLLDHDVVSFTVVLSSSSSAAKVSALQHLLVQAGQSVKVTGKYDSATVKAVKAFQKAKKLTVDGEAGPKTLGALIADVKSGATGNRVKALLALLGGVGYKTDSGFGKTTTASVQQFQTDAGLQVSTTATKNTFIKLFMALDPAPVPTITGKPTVAQKLTANAGKWGPGSVELSYQWYRDGKAIAGATAKTYTVAPEDARKPLTVTVTGVRPAWTSVKRSSAATAAVAEAPLTKTLVPTISGTLTGGETLTAIRGTWGPGTVKYAYQWNRDGKPIKGATAKTYDLGDADVAATLTVTVTGSRTGYTTVSKTSAPTAKIAQGKLKNTPTPKISGTAAIGETLKATAGTWGPGKVTLSYQWKRGDKAIKGATGKAYTVQAADVGAAIKVTVTGSRPGYKSVSKTSTATAVVVTRTFSKPSAKIDGSAKVGKTLTAIRGTWGPAPVKYTYQWKRNGKAIKGATAKTYKLKAADLGTKLTVSITASKAGYKTASKTSAATAKVVKGTLTGASAKVSGTRMVGKTLTAVRGVWKPGKVKYSYQWYRGTSAIKGATGKTYKLTSADRGKLISVRVRGSQAGFTTVDKKALSVRIG